MEALAVIVTHSSRGTSTPYHHANSMMNKRLYSAIGAHPRLCTFKSGFWRRGVSQFGAPPSAISADAHDPQST